MQRVTIAYKPSFLRAFKKLERNIQDEAREKMRIFQDRDAHERLRVHKLGGKLAGFYSFSVTYAHRIVFKWNDAQTAVFLMIGDHDVYE